MILIDLPLGIQRIGLGSSAELRTPWGVPTQTALIK